jgi:hypothetical protein
MSTALIIAGCVLYAGIGFAVSLTGYRSGPDGVRGDAVLTMVTMAFWPLVAWIVLVPATSRMLDARAERKHLPSARALK